MRVRWFVLALAVLASGAASPADQTQVMVPINRFMYAMNHGDAAGAAAACAADMSIIDPVPPYEWHGPDACNRWLAALGAHAAANGLTEFQATLGAPRYFDITGDHAYVVLPAELSYKANGKPMKEPGNTFTVALAKGGSGWQIAAWAWSKK